MAAMGKKDDAPIDVTWEDQQRICTFSRLHRRIQHLLKRQAMLNDDVEKLEDASTEAMICDDVKYVFGEAFVDLESGRAVDFLEEDKERVEEEKAEVAAELKELDNALSGLKAQLYAKFGSQIYLEDKMQREKQRETIGIEPDQNPVSAAREVRRQSCRKGPVIYQGTVAGGVTSSILVVEDDQYPGRDNLASLD